MDLISKERNRLLQHIARAYGLSLTVAALLMLSVPGAIDRTAYFLCLPLFIALGVCQFLMGRSRSLGWIVGSTVTGMGILITIATISTMLGPAGACAYGQVAAGSLAASTIVLTTDTTRRIILTVSAVGVGVGATLLANLSETLDPLVVLGLVALGWTLAVSLGLWINARMIPVHERIANLGRAHRVERQASEREAQRRQGARLLHDTVLATLTLLAHSGVGVSPEALRAQAADDARLLHQLRLGADPSPQSLGGSSREVTENMVLGASLESVKARFERLGLTISWHGTGQVALTSAALDAFLLALAECLENVRRHSGVPEADVTITEDEKTVRAMITDSGVGFIFDDIDSGRLGLKDSVIGRVQEAGGRVRLFSSLGAGTTVVLEVPR